MIGTVISHYKILKKLGQGGMGHVYLAEDIHLGRKAAIKLLAPEFSRDDNIRERFKREAQAVAALSHHNIVTIYEFGDFNHNPYIVMEYVDGDSLRDLQREKKLSLEEIVSITRQICDGLAKSHQTGIIHRDLKPENVLFDHILPRNQCVLVQSSICHQNSCRAEKLTRSLIFLASGFYFMNFLQVICLLKVTTRHRLSIPYCMNSQNR
jgi:serine/threonine protein kinase